MLGKRSRPTTIGKLAGALRSSGLASESATSPRSPLDCNNNLQSPRGPKNYDQQGGIGLGIVVALTNNSNNNYNSKSRGEILAKYALYGRLSNRSDPIPMNTYCNSGNYNKGKECGIKDDLIEEEFTYVTCHGPKKSTRVYYDGDELYSHFLGRKINQNNGVFKISSPARFFDDRVESGSDFLSSCNLCRKNLHGKDIYMYRGEKAFCSEECRQEQISVDEKKEKRKLETPRSGNVLSSPCSYSRRGGQTFSTRIVV